ncbi:MAG: hypothetical protein M1816_001690 [Peltula sp. TS41687]|nr:MAG: hypothetical protein M1816_001690 [Peltula sp. TS41687]
MSLLEIALSFSTGASKDPTCGTNIAVGLQWAFYVMEDGGVFKAETCHSSDSKSLREKLLDAVANSGEEDRTTKKQLDKSALDSTVETSTTRTTSLSTASSDFTLQAYKNGILDPLDSKPPRNLKDVVERLGRARETPSPPESVYHEYVDTIGGAFNEATMINEQSRVLLRYYEGQVYKKAFDQAFTGFPKNVGFNNGLSAPKPDFVEGIRMNDYGRVSGRRTWPGKDMDLATLQSAYDASCLVYARNQALSYVGKPDPADHAKVTTFTTDGTSLNLSAHHAALSGDDAVKYHQYPVTSINLKNSYQGFKQGRRQLRNLQDHAKEQSYALKDQIQENWKNHCAVGKKQYQHKQNMQHKEKMQNMQHKHHKQQKQQKQKMQNKLLLNPCCQRKVEDEDEDGYEIVHCQPTPATSSECQPKPLYEASSSKSSPKQLPAEKGYDPGGGQKRKASLSPPPPPTPSQGPPTRP